MAQSRRNHALDVVGCHKLTRRDQCLGARGANQRDRSARPAAKRDTGPVARSARNPHGVLHDAVIDALMRDDLLQR